ncbi:LuxR family transcriptional regulator [Sphingomonas sp. HMP9]|uniref:PAS domain-containing protein n=1 Tax=Sphingomonas sp. HMP9 TaxID=1517554 RepID=UPI001596DBA4|nr:PAS domain-containing protein [Sphingomonas sp. HMP9]BCA63751.1 LuxR family transcriptional regulator [Sphingomonas sp. HMP9]
MTKTNGKPLHAPTLHHLEQLMTGLLEGVILMDPTGIILSANPAALKMHGVTALADLGETADDYAARFRLRYRDGRKLPRREYPLMRLLAGESFPDLIVEVSSPDADEPRWVHQVRDIVMDEDGGDPDCLGMVINDVSERFDAEDRFQAMFHANPAPALIMRVADQRYVLVNQGFLDLSGYDRDQIVSRTLFDLDFLAEVERKPFVKDRVAAGKTVPQLEAELPLAGGTRRWSSLPASRSSSRTKTACSSPSPISNPGAARNWRCRPANAISRRCSRWRPSRWSSPRATRTASWR